MNQKLFKYCAFAVIGLAAFWIGAFAVDYTVGGISRGFTPSGPIAPEAIRTASGDQGDGSAMIVGGLYVGLSGIKINTVKTGTGTVKNGATTGTATISGIDSTYNVITEITKTYSGSVYKKAAVAETGAVDLIMSGDPGTTVTFSVLAWK